MDPGVNHLPPYILRLNLSLNLELAISPRLAVGIFLPLFLQGWDDRQVPPPPGISVSPGIFGSHTWHLTCEPFTPRPTPASLARETHAPGFASVYQDENTDEDAGQGYANAYGDTGH